MAQEYMPLAEYSMKYKVSISTLRRKIKSQDIQFVFSDNKYLILDQPPQAHLKHRPSPDVQSEAKVESKTKVPVFQSVVIEKAPVFGTPPQEVPAVVIAPVPLMQAHPKPQMPSHPKPLDFIETPVREIIPSAPKAPTVDHEAEIQRMRSQFSILQKKVSASKAHEETILATANKLLADLKKAYAHMILEKEKVIQELRAEVMDLKTLVQVLESENQRLADGTAPHPQI